MSGYAKFNSLGVDSNKPQNDVVSSVEKVRDANHRQSVIGSHKVCVVDNYTDWCGPCKQISPAFSELNSKYGKVGLCALLKENVEDGFPRLQNVPQITGVPCFQFYHNGNFVHSIVGANVKDVEAKLLELLQK